MGQRHSQWTWVQTLREDEGMKSGRGERKVEGRKAGASEIPGCAHLPLLGPLHQNRKWAWPSRRPLEFCHVYSNSTFCLSALGELFRAHPSPGLAEVILIAAIVGTA